MRHDKSKINSYHAGDLSRKLRHKYDEQTYQPQINNRNCTTQLKEVKRDLKTDKDSESHETPSTIY